RHEADGGVERLIRNDLGRVEALRIERQPRLETHCGIGEQKGEETQCEHGRGIARPSLLLVLAHPPKLVYEHLERTHHPMDERALALNELRHEQAARLRQEPDQAEEEQNLNDADASHRTPQNFSGRNIARPRYTSSRSDTIPERT